MIAEICATTRDFKDTGLVIPSTSPFNFPISPVKTTDGSWRMTVGYHMLHQVVTPIAAAVPDVVSLLILTHPLACSIQLLIGHVLFSLPYLRRPSELLFFQLA